MNDLERKTLEELKELPIQELQKILMQSENPYTNTVIEAIVYRCTNSEEKIYK